MSTPLKQLMIARIRQQGPISVADFMDLALAHPEYGYYRSRDPLGRQGDFTTAPEISQLFGEMIGLWFADVWQRVGAPSTFMLVECGPGRGTLMADILRAGKTLQGFENAAQIHLIETSPALREKQAQALSSCDLVWHNDLSTLPQNFPLFVMGNEFLDALPIHQLQMTQDGWMERVIVASGDDLDFGLRRSDLSAPSIKAQPGDIFEVAPVRIAFMQDVAVRIKTQGGAALFIDYGPARSGAGDTLQAVKAHQFAPVLEDVGNADLTSHVDFEAIKNAITEVPVHGPVSQGRFLARIGIETRAAVLMKNASAGQRADIESGLKRLCDPAQMGSLFKVIGLVHDPNLDLAGF